jgi:hypothetical protein
LNAEPANLSLALRHNLRPAFNTYQQLLPTLDITTCLSCFQARVVVIMEKERCHGCDKWFAQIEQHLTYHDHCWSVVVEHARQQRLVVKCRNCNNGMDPLIGTIVVPSACEVDDGMSTGMSTRRATRQRCFKQEDDNQSNITFEGMDVVDDFGPVIPSPSGEVNPMEADFHSRGSISAVHELEVAAYGSHGRPPPLVEPPAPPASFTQASNKTVQLGAAISLPVDDALARMSPNTPTEDVLLDLHLMLLKAGSPLYLFDDIVGFVEKHAGVTLPHQETLMKSMPV